jgi:hypothetical protein
MYAIPFTVASKAPKVTKATVEVLEDNNQLAKSLYENATSKCRNVKLSKGWGKTTIEAQDCVCDTESIDRASCNLKAIPISTSDILKGSF